MRKRRTIWRTNTAAAIVVFLVLAACGGTETAGNDASATTDLSGSTSHSVNGSAGSSSKTGPESEGTETGDKEPRDTEPRDTGSGDAKSGASSSSPTQPTANDQTGSTAADGKADSKTDGEADSKADADAAGINALTGTGPVTAADVPDMQPVVAGARPQLPATVTDARGVDITIESADRVIALDLYGTLVDTVIGLGLHDRLVGRGVSDTQTALADLPVVSRGGIELNVEAVLSLRPDLVLTNSTIGSDVVYQQLEQAGVTVVRFDEVPSIAGISESIRGVSAVFGLTDEGQQLAAHTNTELAAARKKIDQLAAETPREPRALVLYVRGSAGLFFIFGAGYGASDLLRELHLEDVAAENGIDKLTPANPEALVALDPEIILSMTKGVESGGGVAALLARPGMAVTTAGMNKRIITADDAQLLSYGPRTPASLVALAEAIYAEPGR